MSLTIQYIIIGIILSAIAIGIVVKIVKKKNGKGSGCCGCSMYDSCCDKRKQQGCRQG